MNERPYFVHPSGCVEEGAEIGAKSRIWAGSHVMSGAEVGEGCNIGENCFIESGVQIGSRVTIKNNVALYTGAVCEDDVFLGPSCVFTNVINPRAFISRKHEFRRTVVRKGATIGANATVLCGHTVGRYAMIGAGAVVSKDIPDYALVYGVPAVQHGWVCRCGCQLPEFDKDKCTCPECGDIYQKDGSNIKPLKE